MARILITTIRYFKDVPNGNARIACDLAHGFAQAGHSVWYLCEQASASSPEMEMDGPVAILRYRLHRTRFGISWHRHATAAATILHRYLPEPPDVVHGHAPLQYLAARKVYGKKGRWCYTVHSPMVEEMKIVLNSQGWMGRCKAMVGLPWLQRMEHGLLQWSDIVVSLSEYTRTLLVNRYGNTLAGRVMCIPGWMDPKGFHPLHESMADVRTRLGWPVNQPVFFVLRRLEKRMGVDNLLRALDLVRKAGYDFYAVIGGSGSQEKTLHDLCRHLGLNQNVSFMGRVAQDVLPMAYGACDASVIPTAQLECFGIIALEALACGRPVLVTPVGALPELMRQFESAWIAKSHSPEGVADLLCRYLRGVLPPYDGARIQKQLGLFSFSRALREYSDCLNLG